MKEEAIRRNAYGSSVSAQCLDAFSSVVEHVDMFVRRTNDVAYIKIRMIITKI